MSKTSLYLVIATYVFLGWQIARAHHDDTPVYIVNTESVSVFDDCHANDLAGQQQVNCFERNRVLRDTLCQQSRRAHASAWTSRTVNGQKVWTARTPKLGKCPTIPKSGKPLKANQ